MTNMERLRIDKLVQELDDYIGSCLDLTFEHSGSSVSKVLKIYSMYLQHHNKLLSDINVSEILTNHFTIEELRSENIYVDYVFNDKEFTFDSEVIFVGNSNVTCKAIKEALVFDSSVIDVYFSTIDSKISSLNRSKVDFNNIGGRVTYKSYNESQMIINSRVECIDNITNYGGLVSYDSFGSVSSIENYGKLLLNLHNKSKSSLKNYGFDESYINVLSESTLDVLCTKVPIVEEVDLGSEIKISLDYERLPTRDYSK